MRVAFMNVQCTARSGEVGDFLTVEHGGEERVPISPIFNDLVGLFTWMRGNDWKMAEYPDGAFHPWRCVNETLESAK